MLSHSSFVVLGCVADVALAGVFAGVFVDDQSVSAHVIIVAFAGFVAMAVAVLVHVLQ